MSKRLEEREYKVLVEFRVYGTSREDAEDTMESDLRWANEPDGGSGLEDGVVMSVIPVRRNKRKSKAKRVTL